MSRRDWRDEAEALDREFQRQRAQCPRANALADTLSERIAFAKIAGTDRAVVEAAESAYAALAYMLQRGDEVTERDELLLRPLIDKLPAVLP